MINSILIAGGGSAGWITANVLNAVLNQAGRKPVSITLVESPNIPIMGVGEATVPSIRRTLQTIGVTESDFMRATDATFKSLIRFIDWNQGEAFDHPFDRRSRPDTDGAIATWLQSQASPAQFSDAFSILSHLAKNGYAPKAVGWPDYGSTFPYAYHLDAVKLAAFLTKIGTERGITHHFGSIIDVAVDDAGYIEHVKTDTQKVFHADLYIDCTGFGAALIGELDVAIDDYSQHLLCDRAVTLQVPFSAHQPEQLLPYTKATARSSGWNWDINLQGRRGLGYVYSSAHLSPEQAELELKSAEGVHCNDIEARHISFKSSKRRHSWSGNCVAVGLADGFLEPLESSGLYMIEFAAQALSELIPQIRDDSKSAMNAFNMQTSGLYEEVLEYLCLHYATSKRRDTPFWRDATQSDIMPERLQTFLDLWRTKSPGDADFLRNNRLFSLESYEYVLFGMGYTNPAIQKQGGPVPDLRSMLAKCYAKFPKHEIWLQHLSQTNNIP